MRKVDQIYTKQKELQKELEELRENCPHTETYESLYSWRVGSYNPARLCTVCDHFMGYINDTITFEGNSGKMVINRKQ